jgi:hypothetical protein
MQNRSLEKAKILPYHLPLLMVRRAFHGGQEYPPFYYEAISKMVIRFKGEVADAEGVHVANMRKNGAYTVVFEYFESADDPP